MTSHLKGTLLKSQERPVQHLENDLIYKFVHLQILNDCSDNIYAIKNLFALNFPFWFTLPKKRRKGLAHDYNIFATDTDCQTQNGSMLGVYFSFHFCWCFQLWVPSKRNGSVTQFCCFINCGKQSKHEGVHLTKVETFSSWYNNRSLTCWLCIPQLMKQQNRVTCPYNHLQDSVLSEVLFMGMGSIW